METVVALLMFINFEIKEHRIQPSMGYASVGSAKRNVSTVKPSLINV